MTEDIEQAIEEYVDSVRLESLRFLLFKIENTNCISVIDVVNIIKKMIE